MVAALKKKHTVELTKFRFNDEGFNYQGNSYDYQNIDEIRVGRSVFELKTFMVGSSYSHSIGIQLGMYDGESLKLIEQPTMFSNENLNTIAYLEKFLEKAYNYSWENRTEKYISQIKKKGYFSYSGWNIYVKEKMFRNISDGKEYFYQDFSTSRRYGVLLLEKREKSMMDKISKTFGKKEIGIDTLTNSDVFFVILRDLMNINFCRGESYLESKAVTIA